MKYRTRYKEAYQEGIINRSITMSKTAYDLLCENEIDNISQFINDLIIDALNEKDYLKKQQLAAINAGIVDLKQKYGIKLRVVNDEN